MLSRDTVDLGVLRDLLQQFNIVPVSENIASRKELQIVLAALPEIFSQVSSRLPLNLCEDVFAKQVLVLSPVRTFYPLVKFWLEGDVFNVRPVLLPTYEDVYPKALLHEASLLAAAASGEWREPTCYEEEVLNMMLYPLVLPYRELEDVLGTLPDFAENVTMHRLAEILARTATALGYKTNLIGQIRIEQVGNALLRYRNVSIEKSFADKLRPILTKVFTEPVEVSIWSPECRAYEYIILRQGPNIAIFVTYGLIDKKDVIPIYIQSLTYAIKDVDKLRSTIFKYIKDRGGVAENLYTFFKDILEVAKNIVTQLLINDGVELRNKINKIVELLRARHVE